MKIEDVLNQLGGDVLTEDSKKILVEAFDDAVNVRVSEKVDLEVTNALQRLDEQHSTKLTKLLESIDETHTAKLVAVLEKIDADHTAKLSNLIKEHKKTINEDAKTFKESLIKQISGFLDLYLEKAIPKDELKEAVINKRSQKMVEQVKQIISLDESFISDNIKEAVRDGKKTIDNLQRELNEAVKQNIQITQALKSKTAELVLEKNMAGLPNDKKQYVMRMLKDKGPEFINENFEYVVKMFKEEEENARSVIAEGAKKGAKVIKENVDTPRKTAAILESDSSNTSDDGDITGYLSVMERQDRFK